MFDSRWLDTYEDIGEQGVVQFAVTCPICSARYQSARVEAGTDPVATAATAFAAFDAAYHEMAYRCASCGQLACVCCWDDERQLCLRCMGKRLRGDGAVKVGAALAEGHLLLAHTGIYDTGSRPLWRQALLTVRIRGQVLSDRVKRRVPTRSSTPLQAANSGMIGDGAVALLERRPPTSTVIEGTEQDVLCPVCDAVNYDFATYCRNCGARLLERCVTCGEVNAVGAERCVSCDAVLSVQQQQVVLERPATYYSAAEVRRKTYATTTLNGVQTIERETTSPLGKKRRGALRDALAERPVAVLREEVLANHSEAVLAGQMASMGTDEQPVGAQSMARLVLAWSYLRLAMRTASQSFVAFLWAIVVPMCFIVLAGSEYSNTINAIIRTVTHIDVRGEITSFMTAVQSLWVFIHK